MNSQKHTTNRKKKAKIIFEGKTQRKHHFVIPLIAIIILALALVGMISQGSFYIFNGNILSTNKNITNTENNTENVIIATVNGQDIHQKDFDVQWDALPVQSKAKITPQDVLNEIITEQLLLQEAKNKDITITSPELDQFINVQLAQAGIDEEQFKKILQAQGSSLEDVRKIYKNQLIIAKLFDQEITTDLNATDNEINKYYQENKEKFHQDKQMTVRHILIQTGGALNETEALARVAKINSLLDAKNNTNFCDLVSEYSSDTGSVQQCGEYTFGKGQMVKPFEDAAYNMTIGERRTVKSTFGYHIMLKMGEIEEKYLKLGDIVDPTTNTTVKEAIGKVLIQQKAKALFDTYVAQLRDKATIVYHEASLKPTTDKQLLANTAENTSAMK